MVICILFFFTFNKLSLSVLGKTICQYNIYEEFNIVSNTSLLKGRKVSSRIECGAMCSQVDICCSARFFLATKLCELLSKCEPTKTSQSGTLVLLRNNTGKNKNRLFDFVNGRFYIMNLGRDRCF